MTVGLTASEQQIRQQLKQQDEKHIDEIVKETPQVIYWLRTKIADQQRGDDVQIAKAADESKPPVNIDLIDSADLEVRALAFWCDYFGVEPRGDFHRVNGQIVGLALPETARFRVAGNFPKPWHLCVVCAGEWLPLNVDRCGQCRRQHTESDYLQPVEDMVSVLLAALRHNPVPDGIYDDRDYGIQRVRDRNYRRWPQLETACYSVRMEEERIAIVEAEYEELKRRYGIKDKDENQLALGEV